MSKMTPTDFLKSAVAWTLILGIIGSVIFGIFYGLSSLDDDYWHQIDNNCYVHEVDHNSALGHDTVTRTVYCKR